jgi:hypothetical protein
VESSDEKCNRCPEPEEIEVQEDSVKQLYETYKDVRDSDWYMVFDDDGKFKEDIIQRAKNYWLSEVAKMKEMY